MKKIRLLSRTWKFIRNGVAICVTLGLISYLIFRLKPAKILESISKIEWWVLLLSFLIMITMHLLKNVRWYFILRRLNIKINFFETLRLLLIGSFGASITPAKVGDVIRAYYLAKWTETKETTSLFSALLDNVIGVIGMGVFSIIALPFFVQQLEPITKWGIVGGSLIVVFAILVMFNDRIIRRIGTFLIKIRRKEREKTIDNHPNKREVEEDGIMRTIEDYYSHLALFNKKDYLLILLITFSFWFLLGVQVSMFLCYMAGAQMSIQFILTVTGIMTLAAIVSLVPISLSGIGIRDATITVLVLYSLMINAEIAFSASLLQTVINMLIPGSIGGLVLIYSRRKARSKKNKEDETVT